MKSYLFLMMFQLFSLFGRKKKLILMEGLEGLSFIIVTATIILLRKKNHNNHSGSY